MKKNKGKKVKRDRLEVTGVVTEACPAGMFRIDIGQEESINIIGILSGRMRQNFIKIVLGDYVIVELSEYDTTKGRIVKRVGKKGD